MAKISDLPLEQLYQRKITASVEGVIHIKDDFSSINKRYCDTVCKLKCKQYETVSLASNEVDILIIQDHEAPDGKWDREEGLQEKIQRDIIFHLCKAAGFGNLKYRLTSLLKCPPTAEDFPNGKAPTATTLSKCKPYLLEEIKRCKPKVILSLSTIVTKVLGFPKHSNTANRGEIVKSPFGTVVISLHPRITSQIRQNAVGSSGMWGQDYYKVILNDFNKALRIANGSLIVPPLEKAIEFYKKRIRFAKSLNDVESMISKLNSLSDNAVISADTETTSLNGMSKDARILTFQFGFRDPNDGLIKAFVIPLWHIKNTMYDPNEAWKLLAPLLTGPRKKCFQNGKFDILYCYHTTGIRIRNVVFDTMFNEHALDSGKQGCLGLKAITWDRLPHTGLGGYESLLPKLLKNKASDEKSEELENASSVEI